MYETRNSIDLSVGMMAYKLCIPYENLWIFEDPARIIREYLTRNVCLPTERALELAEEGLKATLEIQDSYELSVSLLQFSLSPLAALDYRRTILELEKIPYESFKLPSILALIEEVAIMDGDLALEISKELGVRNESLRGIIREVSVFDLNKALMLAMEVKTSEDRDNVLSQIATSVGMVNMRKSMEVMRLIESQKIKEYTIRSVSRLLEDALKHRETKPSDREEKINASSEGEKRIENPEEHLKELEKKYPERNNIKSDDFKKYIYMCGKLVSDIANVSIDAAIEVVNTLPMPQARAYSLVMISKKLVTIDEKQSIELAKTIELPDYRLVGLTEVGRALCLKQTKELLKSVSDAKLMEMLEENGIGFMKEVRDYLLQSYRSS